MIKWLFIALLRLLLPLLRPALSGIYRVKVKGIERLQFTEKTVLIPNHVSLLDAVILALILPEEVAFVVNTRMAKRFAWPLHFRTHIPVDPLNPYSVRKMLKTVQSGTPLVIFPEGRITTTGSMMKLYGGIGYIASRSQAQMVPIAISGLEHSKFSYLRGKMKQIWFPAVTITIGEAFQVPVDECLTRRAQKERATDLIGSRMQSHIVDSRMKPELNLFNELLIAAKQHGVSKIICEDVISDTALSYRKLLLTTYTMAGRLKVLLDNQKRAAVLLPNAAAHVITLFSLFRLGVTPAILNYTSGKQAMLDACETASAKAIITSRAFIEKAGLADFIQSASAAYTIIYLEEVKESITFKHKWNGMRDYMTKAKGPFGEDQNEVVLFTSGSESKPKGVVLSHRNIFANIQQAKAVIAFNASDILLGAMPMFHSFGLTAGTVLPVLSGMKMVMYPNPLHYKVIPEIVYDRNITILFGTSTFLSAYARTAHAYDFACSLKYVVAGAEKLKEEVRQTWIDKFGIRILEGYGTTETAPVISLNTPMNVKKGTVGRVLPGMQVRIEKVDGIELGGNLLVKGPNVMKGYLIHGQGFVPVPEWYSCGDIVQMDEEGYLSIQGRMQSFAKIGGEKVSLPMVEELVASCMPPQTMCAAITVPDARKGERIVIYHNSASEQLQSLRESMKQKDVPAIYMPSELRYVEKLPLLGSGKVDYVTIKRSAQEDHHAS
ncbi:AMP-binding protein [Paenibacillus aceris]|uniref:Acyl-[acyl-carrier-protein]-phospholipid O-acyltransferase/long-chain-fatty-acid--[acyl-carrier-protein] ligase n=1 Tax=Paenibacillus aceris TaxID=869555 RepID=A0ABS4IAJ6_9BACL|nr:AMP-binding protein [Paenibacillus aceris]MBP1967386.1 acyl-[acyl-carrier-protein]-phospholipid O-acyltransferase/long-chain-fatty-acid--[acyl-carrier-protein] ligase [Paenibacillus aceris]NHW39258.1 AMP-binding protein [Paenibacillus aceris]